MLKNTHVVVLAHGLQGNVGHMQYIATQLTKQSDHIHCINVAANDGKIFKNWSSTGDGIDAGGERIIVELSVEFSSLLTDTTPTQISFIGSSMGGLYCRYVMGKLFDSESKRIVIPVNDQTISMELVNFVALASPLISVRSLIPNWVYYGMKAIFFAGTASQMLLEDHRSTPLIYVMNDGESNYFAALANAKKRMTVCSTLQDESRVPYQSSAIFPFTDITITCTEAPNVKKHSKNVTGYHVDNVGAFSDFSISNLYYESEDDHYKNMIQAMIYNLRSLEWIRVDVGLYHAQAAVLNKNRDDIAQLVCSLFSDQSCL